MDTEDDYFQSEFADEKIRQSQKLSKFTILSCADVLELVKQDIDTICDVTMVMIHVLLTYKLKFMKIIHIAVAR